MMKAQVLRVFQILSRNKWPIFLLWSLWLTLEYFGFGPFSYVHIHDWGDSLLPMRLGVIGEFFEHGFSHWSNLAICGFDRFITTGPFFRLDSLLFLSLPGWLACGLVAFVQRFLASYFTYRLCKDYLKLDELPSIVAGVAYSFMNSSWGVPPFYFQSGFAGEAGFPFILWFLERVGGMKNVTGYVLAFLLGLFVLFSSRFALSVPFMLPVALAWFVLVRRKYSFHFLSLFAVFCVTVLVGEIPCIWALLGNAPLSQRAAWDWSSPPLVTSWGDCALNIRRFLHNNALYLGLGVLALCWSRPKERSLLMVMALLAFCGILARLWPPLVAQFDEYMGFFSGFQFDRFYLLAPFLGVITAACGLHLLGPKLTLTQDNPDGRTRYRVPPMLYIVAIILAVSYLSHFQFALLHYFAPVFLAVAAAVYGLHLLYSIYRKSKYPVQTVLCIMVIVPVIATSFVSKYDRFQGWAKGDTGRGHDPCYAVLYENPHLKQIGTSGGPDPFRVGTIAHGLHPAYACAYGLETVDAVAPLYPKRYSDFWGKVIEPLTSKDEKLYDYFNNFGARVYLFSPSNRVFDTIEEVPFTEYYNLGLLSLANTKYLISPVPLSDEHLTLLASQTPDEERMHGGLVNLVSGIRHNAEGRRLYIYENGLCFARFFLSGKALVFENSNQLLEAMAKADADSLRSNVFVEEELVSKIDLDRLGATEGEVTIEQYSPDQITLSVALDKPGILVVSNSYSPYWTCKVDGVAKNIFPAYHTFMGISLEEGDKLVELEYCPPYWSW